MTVAETRGLLFKALALDRGQTRSIAETGNAECPNVLSKPWLGLDRGYFDRPGELGSCWLVLIRTGPSPPHCWGGGVVALITCAPGDARIADHAVRRTPNRRLEKFPHTVSIGRESSCPTFCSQIGEHGLDSRAVLIAAIVRGSADALFKNSPASSSPARLAMFAFFLMLAGGTLAWKNLGGDRRRLLILWVSYRHEGAAASPGHAGSPARGAGGVRDDPS